MFVYPEPGEKWAEYVQVTNLDSATGADGLVLIEKGIVYWDEPDRVRQALEYTDLKDYQPQHRMPILAENMLSYYGGDVRKSLVIVADYRGNKSSWDGWAPDKEETIRLHKEFGGDLASYVESEWLD